MGKWSNFTEAHRRQVSKMLQPLKVGCGQTHHHDPKLRSWTELRWCQETQNLVGCWHIAGESLVLWYCKTLVVQRYLVHLRFQGVYIWPKQKGLLFARDLSFAKFILIRCWSDMKKQNATEIMSARCLIKIVTKLVVERWYLLSMHADTAVGGLFLSASQELTQPMANLTKAPAFGRNITVWTFIPRDWKRIPTSLHHNQRQLLQLLHYYFLPCLL